MTELCFSQSFQVNHCPLFKVNMPKTEKANTKNNNKKEHKHISNYQILTQNSKQMCGGKKINKFRSYHISGQFLSSDFTLQPDSLQRLSWAIPCFPPWKHEIFSCFRSFYLSTITLLQTAPLLLSAIFQTTFFFKLPHSSFSSCPHLYPKSFSRLHGSVALKAKQPRQYNMTAFSLLPRL